MGINGRHSGSERRRPNRPVTVKLWKKYAERIDGVDLSGADVGDVLTVPSREARLLIAEGWAALADPQPQKVRQARTTAADRPRR